LAAGASCCSSDPPPGVIMILMSLTAPVARLADAFDFQVTTFTESGEDEIDGLHFFGGIVDREGALLDRDDDLIAEFAEQRFDQVAQALVQLLGKLGFVAVVDDQNAVTLTVDRFTTAEKAVHRAGFISFAVDTYDPCSLGVHFNPLKLVMDWILLKSLDCDKVWHILQGKYSKYN